MFLWRSLAPRTCVGYMNAGGGVLTPNLILVGMCRGKVKNWGLRIELERENAGLRNWL